MEELVRIRAGTLTANREERIVTGLLLPYGELGNTNLGKFAVAPGTITVPRDPIVIGLNVDHDRELPVGRALSAKATEEGIVATFKIAEGPEGDEVLDGIDDGTRRSLSAEVAEIVIRDGQAVGGRLFGAAVCKQGAFPSAAVYASDVGELPETTDTAASAEEGVADMATLEAEVVTVTTESNETTSVDDGQTVETVTEVTSSQETYTTEPSPAADAVADPAPADPAAADPVTTEVVDVTNTEAAPATEDPNAAAMAADETTTEGEADVPDTTMTASVAQGSLASRKAAATRSSRSTFAEFANAFRKDGKTGLFSAMKDPSLYAALSDVVPGDLLGLGAPEYLGEVWAGARYQRKIVPLVTNRPLTNRKFTGWKWVTAPVMDDYDGSKAPIPSASLETEEVTIDALRLACGHDIDRIYADFGDTEFFNAYFEQVVESYRIKTDSVLFDAMYTGLTPVTLATVNPDVPQGFQMIAKGAVEIAVNSDSTLQASFALVAPDLYVDMVSVANMYGPSLLNPTASVPSGAGVAGGLPYMVWSGLGAGEVLVGAGNAVTFYELAGVPIQVDAWDIVNGGTDRGAFGYYATNIVDDRGLVLVADES